MKARTKAIRIFLLLAFAVFSAEMGIADNNQTDKMITMLAIQQAQIQELEYQNTRLQKDLEDVWIKAGLEIENCRYCKKKVVDPNQ